MSAKKRPLNQSESSYPKENPQTPKESSKVGTLNTLDDSIANLQHMERRKMRRIMDKERHRLAAATCDSPSAAPISREPLPAAQSCSVPPVVSLRISLFGELAVADTLTREAAAAELVAQLRELQRVYVESGGVEKEKAKESASGEDGAARLEAEKDAGLEEWAPSLRYAVRRLIRGVSSSREFARQGFALGLTVVIGAIPAVKVELVRKLIASELEVSSSMKGQEVRDILLGRLFAFGSLVRSGRIASEYTADRSSSVLKDYVSDVISLARKKRYLTEPAVSIILDLVEKLPDEALITEVIGAPGMHDLFEGAMENGDPDALFVALKLQERINTMESVFGKLLPHPFSINSFFQKDNLLCLASCFKESTFCLPRLHSIWPVIINLLVPEVASQEDIIAQTRFSKKPRKSKKGSSSEDVTNNIRNFCEVVVEGSLMLSSHDRKHLALNILLILLPKVPICCIQIVLSMKIVQGLMDMLSHEKSLLHHAGQHFLKEFLTSVADDDHRCIATIIALQKNSSGRFDSVTRTSTVKQLVGKLGPSCLHFVHDLISLFLDEGPVSDEPSDQSHTTDENSEGGSAEDKDVIDQGNADALKNWVIEIMPRVLKNFKVNVSVKTLTETEKATHTEELLNIQREIMKFLSVQGLFAASLGTEVTSLELQEKFKWPKFAVSSALREVCIERLQLLLEDAQKREGSPVLKDIEVNDLGSYFMRFIKIIFDIPSVSIYHTMNKEDETAFKKLLEMGPRLASEETIDGRGSKSSKLHALRYLLIQLLLQILLHPGEFSVAAMDLIICCKKAFPGAAHGDSSNEEDEPSGPGVPEFMDVLVDTLLSLLPQSARSTCFAIEQVFRAFCDEITHSALLQLLKVVKKDLKPPRRTGMQDGDDEEEEDDDDFIGIEDSEEADGVDTADAHGNEDHADESDGISEGNLLLGDQEHQENNSGVTSDADASDSEVTKNKELPDSDDSDGMDDDAMFRLDAYISRVFKERKFPGNDSAHSQLVPFKLRVLSLLEIYLHRNPGKAEVITVYTFLFQAFVKYYTGDGSEQLRQRIGGILQKKIFKAKDYPKGNDIELSDLEMLLEKSLKLVSRSRIKAVVSLAETATFWILKIINVRGCSKDELEGSVSLFRDILIDYFDNKKSRLKIGFLKLVIQRHQWLGMELFAFLLEKCRDAKSEYRRVHALDLLDSIMKSLAPTSKGDQDKHASGAHKLMKKQLPVICVLMQQLLSSWPEKQSRRAEVRKFCVRVLQTIASFGLTKPFLKALHPDTYSVCQSKLGNAFTSLTAPKQ